MANMLLLQSTCSHETLPNSELEYMNSNESKSQTQDSSWTMGCKSDHDIDEFGDKELSSRGYQIISKICDTLQGELLRAQTLKYSKQSYAHVAIKKTEKSLFKQKTIIRNEISYCVSENIVKEALILNLLTVENKPCGNYICKYIDFFESRTHFYLVMEYISGNINLKDFVYGAHKYMKIGKLSQKEYHKTIKYLMWQLAVTLRWLHDDIHCCHLDICMENVMLQNCEFFEQEDGTFTINPDIQIKLCDFGVAEIFKTDKVQEYSAFSCLKPNLSFDNELYLAPEIYAGKLYDARSADMWSLGILLYSCIFGRPLINDNDCDDDVYCLSDDGDGYLSDKSRQQMYWMLYNKDTLKCYLKQQKLLQFVSNNNVISLILGLLNVKPSKRLIVMDVLKHKWFKTYWKQYHKRIEKKIQKQRGKLADQYKKFSKFPYYVYDGFDEV